jgi:hypothetical protein
VATTKNKWLDPAVLTEAMEKLGKAVDAFETLWLEIDEDRIPQEAAWALVGFTDDALLYLDVLTRRTVDLRTKSKGGTTESEIDLVEAFNRVCG